MIKRANQDLEVREGSPVLRKNEKKLRRKFAIRSAKENVNHKIDQVIPRKVDRQQRQNFESIVDEMLISRTEINTKLANPKFRKRILKSLRTAEYKKGTPLDKTEITYLTHFWLQLLDRHGIRRTHLKYDDPERVFYDATPEKNPEILSIVRLYVTNFDEVIDQFLQKAENFSEILKEKSVLVVTNHDQWPTQFLSLAILRTALNHPVNKAGLILGPAIMTFAQSKNLLSFDSGSLARSSGNVYCRFPDTPNGNIPELQSFVELIRKRFSFRLVRDLKAPGNIISMAPSGTSDKHADGKIMAVTPDDNALKFLGRVSQEMGIHVILMGFNQQNLYKNGVPSKSDIQVGFEVVEPNSLAGDPKEVGHEIMRKTMRLVHDERKKGIGVYQYDKENCHGF